MSKLRGLVVGAGFFCDFHLDAWARIGEVAIVGVCDVDIEKAASLANKYSIEKVYSDVEEAISELAPDFVDIVTPPSTHLKIIEVVAGSGLAMICQKPLADDRAGANAIAAVIRDSNVPFMMHENFRFQPWHRKIKQILNGYVIGKLQTITMRTRMGDGWPEDAYQSRQPYFRTMPRMLVHETGIHFIDLFRYLAGEIANVDARLRKLNSNIVGEDCGSIDFVFESDAFGRWDADRYHESLVDNPRYTFGEMTIDCDKGSLWLAGDGTITIKPLGQPAYVDPYTPSRHGFAGDCVYATQLHFVDFLRGRCESETSLESTMRNLEIVEQVYASNRHKQTPTQPKSIPRIVDLSLPISNELRGAAIEPAKTIAIEGWNATTLKLYSHCGTHMDAPRHFIDDAATIDSQSLETCCGAAVLIDLTPVEPRELLTIERVKHAIGSQSVPKRILFRTDWHKRLGTPEYRDGLPQISIELAHWLVDNDVNLIGVEPPSVADVNEIVELTEVHQILFRGGITIVEGLANLDQLTSKCVTFIALPLKIIGGDGCPVRAIAIENIHGGLG